MDTVYCVVEDKEIVPNENCVEDCEECGKLQEQLIEYFKEDLLK